VRTKDHLRLISEISRASIFGAIFVLFAFLIGISGFIFDFVLTEKEQLEAAKVIRSMFSYWYLFIIAGLAVICVALYRRIAPKVGIVFKNAKPYFTFDGKTKTYRADLINYGDWQDNISFRLEYIEDNRGNILPYERMGFQREAGKGPMPLSPESPKYGYLASLDQSDPNSTIDILTISDVASGYQPESIQLPRGTYLVHASLNPRMNRPCKRTFRVWVDGSGDLQIEEARGRFSRR
jgi:hypothetical protein